ncbi:hypothetical protein BTO10_21040 [Vibrio chagasii]|uniref:Heparin-sulfate lyase N-terminal domain-containing protein n=1 Tax=Vibrio chagasii TaxID=170679 RepID=A0A2S7V7M5_9VIBR|nr:hypothetical protein [Vibrio chagasii]PQJ58203.1 hypothetical protein BTO10_21040 [Vibrio chagasii]
MSIRIFEAICPRLRLELSRFYKKTIWKLFPDYLYSKSSGFTDSIDTSGGGEFEFHCCDLRSKASSYLNGEFFYLMEYNLTPSESPHDWFFDYKSQYLWSNERWYKDYKIPPRVGVDVKRVWEVSRFNFLPVLALDYHQNNNISSLNGLLSYVSCFNNSNKPFTGINWYYSMDVGIRIFNLLVSMKTISNRVSGNELESIKLMISHGYYHVINNLENYRGRTNNHYLCNVLGVFSYLYVAKPTKCRLKSIKKFSLSFERELRRQFNQDGSSFEGSSYYHRLSLECVLYTYLIIYNINQEYKDIVFVSEDSKKIIYKAVVYYIELSYNGKLPMFGDNDSGVIFSLALENELINKEDRRYLPELESLIKWLGFDSENEVKYDYSPIFESMFPCKPNIDFSELNLDNITKPFLNTPLLEFSNENFIYIEGSKLIKVMNFPDAGIIVMSTSKAKLYFKYTNFMGCHSHNDLFQVSILSDSIEVEDNGTFEYSSFKRLNDINKSYLQHNGPKDKSSILVDYIDGYNITADVEMSFGAAKATIKLGDFYLSRSVFFRNEGFMVIDSSNLEIKKSTLNIGSHYQYGHVTKIK